MSDATPPPPEHFRIKPEVFKPGLFQRSGDELGLGELQRLVFFFERGDHIAARRVRAMLLRKKGEKLKDLHHTVKISERQCYRWLQWWDKGGLKGLLNKRARFYRQCPRCHKLGLVGRHFSPANKICHGCNAARNREAWAKRHHVYTERELRIFVRARLVHKLRLRVLARAMVARHLEQQRRSAHGQTQGERAEESKP